MDGDSVYSHNHLLDELSCLETTSPWTAHPYLLDMMMVMFNHIMKNLEHVRCLIIFQHAS